MQFIYPLGFLALASILLPILIHFWNVKQGKTLKIGSIAFLGESSNKSSRSFKITDWLLLMIRCLLLILIAFLLAQPFINQKTEAKNNIGWVLVSQNDLKEVYQQEQKIIDSLVEKGFQLHDFNVGFKAIELGDSVSKEQSNLSHQALLAQLNSTLPQGFKVYLFANNNINIREDKQLKTVLNVVFKPFIDQDSVIEKVADAYFTNQDSIRMMILKTSQNQSKYEVVSLKNDNKNIDLKIENGLSFVKTKSQINWVRVNDETLRISVYNPKNDAYNYLNAAFISIRDYTQKRMVWQKIKKDDVNLNDLNFLFWLSDEEIPKDLKLKNGAKLFAYQKGKEEMVNSNLNLNQGNENVDLFKRISYQKDETTMIWKDGFGKPILSFNEENQVKKYRFYSRFEPQWTDLVWKADFAQALLPIILTQPERLQNFGFETDSLDRRVWDKHQNFFEGITAKQGNFNIQSQQSISNWFWFATFFLLFIERFLSYLKGNK